MKRITALLVSALIFLSVACNAVASNVHNRVYADVVTVEAGEQVTIPVKIENNNGFMGFTVIITYNDDVFAPRSVSKSSMLSGMFNDSIATSSDNSFKVVFTGTGDIVSDGVLFNIVFDVSDDASGIYGVELSYSQQDTFKENWSNAVFNCEKAKVVVTVNGTTAPVPSTTNVLSTTVAAEPTTHPVTAEPSTTEPDISETTTNPANELVTEPSTEVRDEPDAGKPLSVRMREWVNGLQFPLNILLGVFVIPVSYIVAIFE